jgi:2-C-methyl-D-erythritol 4-phosphate cytidylyltransferase
MSGFLKEKNKPCTVAAIIAAAGQSSRMNNENKQFADILGRPVLAYSLEAFENSPSVDEIYVVSRENDILFVSDIIKSFNITKAVSIVPGGQTRSQSVKKGLEAAGDCSLIAIHDGARPCILPEHIELTIAAAAQCGAAALGCPVTDTLKKVNDDLTIAGTIERNGLWQIQTPQVFKSEIIRKAYEQALHDATDDCALVESMGVKVRMVRGTASNIKITHKDDICTARGIIAYREENGA